MAPGAAGDGVGVAHHLTQLNEVDARGLGQPLGLADGGEGGEVEQVARQLGLGAGTDGPEVGDEPGPQVEGLAAGVDGLGACRPP